MKNLSLLFALALALTMVMVGLIGPLQHVARAHNHVEVDRVALPPGQIGTTAVTSSQKISSVSGNFTGPLVNGDSLGAVTDIGDLNGDGVTDLAVGAPYDVYDTATADAPGAVYILFMKADGTVLSQTRIASDLNGMPALEPRNAFGLSLSSGDFNGDGRKELVVGAPGGSGWGGANSHTGEVWVLFLNADGTVNNSKEMKFSAGSDNYPNYGSAVAVIGDVCAINWGTYTCEKDNIPDLLVGGSGVDDSGTGGVGANAGAFWVILMDTNGLMKDTIRLMGPWMFPAQTLEAGDRMGSSLVGLGDLDGDGYTDYAVGIPRNNAGPSGSSNRGAVLIIFSDIKGEFYRFQKISSLDGNFGGTLANHDFFGSSLANIGDINGDGTNDLAVGTAQHDGGSGGNGGTGVVWILGLNTNGTVKSTQKLDFTTGLDANDGFGGALVGLTGARQIGAFNLAVGAPRDDDGGTNRGAVWLLSFAGEATHHYTYVPLILKNQ